MATVGYVFVVGILDGTHFRGREWPAGSSEHASSNRRSRVGFELDSVFPASVFALELFVMGLVPV